METGEIFGEAHAPLLFSRMFQGPSLSFLGTIPNLHERLGP